MSTAPSLEDILSGDKGLYPACYDAGFAAVRAGKTHAANPYIGKSSDIWRGDRYHSWSKGWYDGLETLTDEQFAELQSKL